MKKGFTLAEIMISLTVIGIIAGITIPIANNSRPDENVMKFKKAHATLSNVIHELVTSDKYFCKGDLGIKNNCSTQLFFGGETSEYFCQSFADLLSTKTINCISINNVRRIGDEKYNGGILLNGHIPAEYAQEVATNEGVKLTVTPETIKTTKEFMDSTCMAGGKDIGAEIITTDGITFYSAGTGQFGSYQFASLENNNPEINDILRRKNRIYSPPDQFPANYADQNGFDIAYKIFCVDVDGIPNNVTTTDCVNECPFGYGIRADGKILTGARADVWLEKGFQKGKNDN